MKITSCDCIYKDIQNKNVEVFPTVRTLSYDALTGFKLDTGYDIEIDGDILIDYKYCPYCGKKLEVEE